MKGVSPIISAVLLIAFTLTVASISAPFFTKQVEKGTDSASEQADKIMDATDIKLDITRARYNRSSQNLTVYVMNRGSERVENFTVNVYGDKPHTRSFSTGIASGGVKGLELNAGDSWALDEVTVSMTDYPVSITKHLDGRPSENKLVAYYAFDEGSGQWSNDTVSGFHGKLGGSTSSETTDPGWTSGVFGSAVNFDGNNDGIDMGIHRPELTGENSGFTIGFWMKKDGLSDEGAPRVISTDQSEYWAFDISNNGAGRMDFITSHNDGTRWDVINGFTPTNDTWYHIMATYSPKTGKKRLYRNGKLIGSKTLSGSPWLGYADYNRPLGIGSNVESGVRYDHVFNGTIDELRIWNTALPPEKVKNPVRVIN